MATYAELLALSGNSNLQTQIRVACIVAADEIWHEQASTANHANRLKWAKGVYENPELTSRNMLWAVLAANRGLTVAQIQSASDVAVQSAVDAVVDLFAV